MKRILFSSAIITVLAVVMCHGPSARAQGLSNGDGNLRVMTYNVDEGTDYLEVQQAKTQTQFLIAVGQTITQVRATNPPARMQAVAAQIIQAAPDLVSLQELDRWYSGPFNPATGTCGPVTLEFDILQELLNALAAQGANYVTAIQAQQFAFPPTPGLLPPASFLCIAVVNFNAILARTDIDPAIFQWSNAQSGQFVNKVFLPTPIGMVPLPRAWVSVDAQLHGRSFRFVGTHLETVDPHIRELQGSELRLGPANTSTPVVVAMDSNAPAFPLPPDATYLDFIAAGYNDAWANLNPLDPGLTCCQAQLVNNPVSQLTQRIDLILTLGNLEARKIALLGIDPASMTPGGLWPSDHAGVAARLAFREDPE